MRLIDTFMPDDLCARCAEREPVMFSKFKYQNQELIKLGFCSEVCEMRFVRGMVAARELTFL